LLCAGAATALAAVTVLSAGRSEAGDILVLVIAGWWVVAALIGAWLGRQAETNSPIARLLASAKSTTSLPEQRPGALLVNRLWPLLLSTIFALGLEVVEQAGPERQRALDHEHGERRERDADAERRGEGDRGEAIEHRLRRQRLEVAVEAVLEGADDRQRADAEKQARREERLADRGR